MSRIYSVDATLGIKYSDENISKIIKVGAAIGFIYYNHSIGKIYEECPIFTPEEAFQKIISIRNDPDEDQSLYVEISPGRFSHLWFYNDEGFLQVSLGSFAYKKERLFVNSNTVIDFEFYVLIMLKLVHDFGIERLNADYFD